MDQPLSELLAECESALRLYRFTQKAYGNLVDHCPEALVEHVHALNPYLFRELQDTLRDELTKEETTDLCALVEGLKADRGGKLWE